MHSDKEKWKSYQHPNVECKMLSPQSLHTYTKQFSRYAEGTYDILFSVDNPIKIKGLSLKQRLAYFETIYSYLSPFWILIFLLSPIIFYFSLTPPIKAFNFDFFLRFIFLNIFNQLVITIGNWGISTKRSEQYYIGGIWLKIKAFLKIASGSQIQFNTTAKLGETETWQQKIILIYPHLLLILLTLVGMIYNSVLVFKNTHPSYSAFVANTIWASYNVYQISPIIFAALKKNKES
jgi:cellulose synthase (UDP-forming)